MNRTVPAWAWWAALVLPLWLVLVLCTSWEPVLRDGWGHMYWHHGHDISLSGVIGFFKDSWLGSNPRLGQTLTLLVHTPGPYHAIATPLVELGMFVLLATLALGRWPSVRRADDALVVAIVTAIVALCTPQIGPMLFYRPFTGNYLFGLVLNLLWLVPYRIAVATADGRPPLVGGSQGSRWWLAPPMLVLGVAAGMCNEHTGPAFLAMGTLAVIAMVRGKLRISPWMLAGLVGLVAGYLLLLLAPGQDARYNHLATQAGILERIAERGVAGNLRVVWMFAFYLLHAVPWVALGLLARWFGGGQKLSSATGRALLVLAAAGIACTLTLLASPKLGSRLYLASVALGAAAIAGWVCTQVVARWARRACVALSVGALVYFAVRCLATYHAVAPVGATRLHAIQHGAPGSTVIVPRYPVAAGRWFLGDDFEVETLRQALAVDYGLAAIVLEPR